MKTDQYNYDLPKSFIAQVPLEPRDHSRLLILNRKTGETRHEIFYNIINYLNEGDVLVLNESRVTKCRLTGVKDTTGAKIECFLLKKIKSGKNEYFRQVLIKPVKRIKNGDKVWIEEYFFEIIQKQDYGKAIVRFNCNPDKIIEKYGKVPLPPYINNTAIEEKRYQTIYAKVRGSSAAPTAGFHFTKNLLDKIIEKGISLARVRLDIGLDTFRPIVEECIEEHVIHKENYFVSKGAAEKIMETKAKGKKVISVGTTTARVLETVSGVKGRIKPGGGETGLYIYPGYRFRTVDSLLTNFHLPHSTLLVMVCAFAGREIILNAYEEAKSRNYRFFSFGDCMLII